METKMNKSKIYKVSEHITCESLASVVDSFISKHNSLKTEIVPTERGFVITTASNDWTAYVGAGINVKINIEKYNSGITVEQTASLSFMHIGCGVVLLLCYVGFFLFATCAYGMWRRKQFINEIFSKLDNFVECGGGKISFNEYKHLMDNCPKDLAKQFAEEFKETDPEKSKFFLSIIARNSASVRKDNNSGKKASAEKKLTPEEMQVQHCFAMWTLAMAACWADGEVNDGETAEAKSVLSAMMGNFSPEQKQATLTRILAAKHKQSKVSLKKAISEIEKVDKPDYMLLDNVVQLIVRSDNIISDEEQKFLDSWKKYLDSKK